MALVEEDRGSRIAELLAYLRESEGQKLGAAELAERFSLEKEFVSRLLSGIRPPKSSLKRDQAEKRQPFVQKALAWFVRSVDAKPILYVLLSFLIWIILASITKQLDSGRLSEGASGVKGMTITFSNVSQFLLFMGLLAAHGSVYFRKGTPLLAAKGAVAILLPLWMVAIVAMFIEPQKGAGSVWQRLFIYIFAFLILGALYTGAFSFVSSWGAYARQKRADAKLSRQQLLQRYFDLNERLKHSIADYVPKPHRFQNLIINYKNNPYTWAIFLGLFYALLSISAAAYSGIDPYDPKVEGHLGPQFILLILPLALFSMVIFACMAFYAGNAKKASVVALIYALANDLGHLFISRGRSFTTTVSITSNHRVYRPNLLLDMAINLVGQMAIGAAIGAGSATMRERPLREKKLQANDPATLASELLNVQMRLTEQPTRVYVMVVDAVGSTAMKSNVDTLTAEYAFRLYQQWIARVSAMFRGTIHSTAGDGAIVAFSNADEALSCATELQRDIERFNREENKLKIPFRVRIGLHAGAVGADLREVQFTRVIDVAAHIEKVSPIGGLALSEEILHGTSSLAVTDDGQIVDGSRIYTVGASSFTATALP